MYKAVIAVVFIVAAWYLFNKFNNTAYEYVDGHLFPKV